ncbi:COMPASS (complex proteins associated with Set1p) component [Cytospora paraplurivora]|uniref:COMPASS (Complex proteins associated with Set1p) component n=1 Tax=Cytospora paraplurivora TaxID=2898453 RepID=A0AAN9TWU6_9PEZI
MSESTPIPDPSTFPDGSGAAQTEGVASVASIQNEHNGTNGQDTTMGGQEDPGVKAVKPGDNPANNPQSSEDPINAPSPRRSHSYRSDTNPGMVTLKLPSDVLAQLTLNNNTTTTPTPTPTTNANTMVGRSFVPDPATTAGNSRAASADRTGDRVAMPTEAAAHGAPTRQYLNAKVTYHVMEAMKIVAKERPADPLRVLGEFLLQRSKEVEGTANGTGANGDEAKDADKIADKIADE